MLRSLRGALDGSVAQRGGSQEQEAFEVELLQHISRCFVQGRWLFTVPRHCEVLQRSIRAAGREGVEGEVNGLLEVLQHSIRGWKSHEPWLRCLDVLAALAPKGGAQSPLLLAPLRTLCAELAADHLGEEAIIASLSLLQQVLACDAANSEALAIAACTSRVALRSDEASEVHKLAVELRKVYPATLSVSEDELVLLEKLPDQEPQVSVAVVPVEDPHNDGMVIEEIQETVLSSVAATGSKAPSSQPGATQEAQADQDHLHLDTDYSKLHIENMKLDGDAEGEIESEFLELD